MISKLKIPTFIFLIGFLPLGAQGQVSQKSELGLGLGIFKYVGDLSKTYDFTNSKPAVTLLYRLNLSKVITLKTAITGGMIGANDNIDPVDALANRRSASFDLFLLEGAATFEYHFFDWRDKNRRIRLIPYLFAGVGLFGISEVEQKNAEYSNVQLNVPFGGGAKYILNPNWYLALEIGFRQTFFDYLDNISGGDSNNKNYQYGDKNDYDAYFFIGLSINYAFYKIPCSNSPY